LEAGGWILMKFGMDVAMPQKATLNLYLHFLILINNTSMVDEQTSEV
jgi:hypothetical protein